MKKISKENYFDLAVFCMDYHSGQWSRGYRLLCRLLGKNGHLSDGTIAECRESECYAYLVANYYESV